MKILYGGSTNTKFALSQSAFQNSSRMLLQKQGKLMLGIGHTESMASFNSEKVDFASFCSFKETKGTILTTVSFLVSISRLTASHTAQLVHS